MIGPILFELAYLIACWMFAAVGVLSMVASVVGVVLWARGWFA